MRQSNKLLVVMVLVLLLGFGSKLLGQPSRPVDAQGPPGQADAIQGCAPMQPHIGRRLFVSFTWWAHTNWDEAWVDLSLVDNGFLPGTYAANGPIGKTSEILSDRLFGKVVWYGIEEGQTHYWRVNLRIGDKWYPSPTQSFVSQVCSGAAPSAVLPPVSLPDNDVDNRLDDLEQRLDRLERDVGYVSGGSLAGEVTFLQSQIKSLRSCVNDYIPGYCQ